MALASQTVRETEACLQTLYRDRAEDEAEWRPRGLDVAGLADL